MDLHGGNIFNYDKKTQQEILDYSSNINPLGVSNLLKKSIGENFHLLEKYPDPYYRELRVAIGEFNAVSPENILVGNGAVEVLFLYLKALKPKKAMIVSPTFAEYERGLKNIGCSMNYFELFEKDDFKLDVQRLLDELSDEELVVLCNPNNPTGKFIQLSEIAQLNSALESRGVRLFIDECFIEFIEGWENLTAALLKSPNIFILRAYTKFFGIPGLRLGYGIVYDSDLLKSIQEIREPWSVNSFAELAGKILPRDKEYIKKTYDWINEEKKWFWEKLSENKNIKVYKTETNFILIKLLHMKAEKLKKQMLQKDFLIRDASNFKYLDDTFVRLAIKDRKNNEKIIKAIMEETEWKQY